MLWIVLALQAMTPFIHAHADAMHLGHGDGPHLHHATSAKAMGHAVVHGEPDVTVDVAQGLPSRAAHAIDGPAGGTAERPVAAVATARLAAAFPIPPPLHLASPDHALPPALAPPRR